MPVTHAIYPEQHLLCARFTDRVGLSDLLRYIAESRADPAYRPGLAIFNDMGAVRDFHLGFSDMMTLRKHLLPGFRNAPRTVLIGIYAPGDVAYGMSRMHHALLAEEPGVAVGVFRDAAECAGFLAPPEARAAVVRAVIAHPPPGLP